MLDPLFWLGLSILLVAVSLTAVLVAALPALQELARAARSAEKLFDTLSRELPPTLESIRLTGLEISDLTDEVNKGVQSASQVVQQVDDSIDTAKKQAQKVQVTTKSVWAGLKAGWKTLTKKKKSAIKYRHTPDPLPSSAGTALDFEPADGHKRTGDLEGAERSQARREADYLPSQYLPKPESDRPSSQPVSPGSDCAARTLRERSTAQETPPAPVDRRDES